MQAAVKKRAAALRRTGVKLKQYKRARRYFSSRTKEELTEAVKEYGWKPKE